MRTIVFQAGLKAGFCPALASSGPVCPGIALLLAHGLAARRLPLAYGLGDGAKPPENRQNSPVAALHQLRQDGAGMNEREKQFSFTRAVSSTSGRAKNQIPISFTFTTYSTIMCGVRGVGELTMIYGLTCDMAFLNSSANEEIRFRATSLR